jgi:peptide subunit release factor 1 (eRF1)
MTALRAEQVDVLVLAKDYQPGEGWGCFACGRTQLEPKSPEACPTCQSDRLRQFDIKEEMVRLAEQLACGVEVVDHSDPLMQLGGAGCLLRYAAATNYRVRAA